MQEHRKMESDEPEIRPLPFPPRCRGVALGNGDYAGCPYGDGELRSLTRPCDCPVCHGSGFEGLFATFVPHSSFGDPECCGFLYAIVRGERGCIECNDCDAAVRTVPAAELQQTLTEMELTLDFCTEMCAHCGKVNIFPGFSKMLAFVCKYCGQGVKLSEGPEHKTASQ